MDSSKYDRYIEALEACRVVNRLAVPKGIGEQELLELIHSSAEVSYQYMQENKTLLNELVFTRKPHELSDEDIAELRGFAGRLFAYSASLDCGIAYVIHKMLLECAKFRGDEKMIIRELYDSGIALHYINVNGRESEINPMGERVRMYFEEGAAYITRYEEFDKETKSYILRCLGNCKLDMAHTTREETNAYLRVFRRAMAVLTSPYYRQLDPDLPWEQFEYAMHMDRMTLLTYLRERDDPEIAQEALISSRYIQAHQKNANLEETRLQNWRIGYFMHAARYHAVLCDAREVVEDMLEVAEKAGEQDYSLLGIGRNVTILAYMLGYECRMKPEDRAELSGRIHACMDKSIQYLEQMPANDFPRMINFSVQVLIMAQAERGPAFCHEMLKYMLVGHKPTYVHSMMVALLTRRMMTQMVRTNPDALIGLQQLETAEEIAQKEEELEELAYQCGMYHDIGKNMVLSFIDIYARPLIDEEFTCIKTHPSFGDYLLTLVGREKDLAKAALYHHRSYDGKSGYPQNLEPCPRNMKPLVDILSVADSMDAATDFIGRSYTRAKTLEQLLEELRAGSGTRYSPDVVRLFDDTAFCAEIEDMLVEQRKRVYVEIYRAAGKQ